MVKRQLVKISDKVAWRIIGNEAVIISLENTWVRGLNPVATRIWQLIDGKSTTEGIAQTLSNEFKVSLAQAREDTQQLLEQLKKRRLVSQVER